jgi:zinc/manganese transport system substrate-binding protein
MPNSKNLKPKNYRIAIIFAVIIVTVVAAIMLLQMKKTPDAASHKIRVVAAENFWGNIMTQLGGSTVEVTSVISDPGADPHLYESNARDGARLAQADVVITNGLGYDDFMDRLLAVSKNDSRQVLSVANILKVSGKTANPHLWYDLPKIREVANVFSNALAAKDPANAKKYAANLAVFNRSLQPVLDMLYKIKTTHLSAPVLYTERVPEYLLAAAGLAIKTPAGFSSAIEEGNDPSPADTTAMENLIAKRQVKVLLYNAQATSSVTEHIKQLAVQNGIPVVGVTETMPANEHSYQSWQLDQAKALSKALESK